MCPSVALLECIQMCKSLKGKLALGGGVVLLAIVIILGLWVAFRPNNQRNVGDHQTINNKNEIIGLETNLGMALLNRCYYCHSRNYVSPQLGNVM